ncbi:MAG TPA: c(7)-type cytochrome triheme domain-containing protein [Thermodesulfovibrionales bacterium]|nr:c(7)-type cytochrome triheme domain-containing protein [Thermodesulfovibrionales bacterium]
MRWFLYFCLFIIAISCSSRLEGSTVEKPRERMVSMDEAIGQLPCFRCHSYQKFTSSRKGGFPHALHLDKGYHCNQCHSYKAHSFMRTNTKLCKDCHSLKTFVYSTSGYSTRFNHEGHARLGCKECHIGIFQMKKGLSKITMDAIYQGRFCGACHNGKKAFSSSECSLCHEMKEMKTFKKNLLYKGGKFGDVTFSHEFHTQLFACKQCHPGIFGMKKTENKMPMDSMYAGKYCGSCHNAQSAFSSSECRKCHKS